MKHIWKGNKRIGEIFGEGVSVSIYHFVPKCTDGWWDCNAYSFADFACKNGPNDTHIGAHTFNSEDEREEGKRASKRCIVL